MKPLQEFEYPPEDEFWEYVKLILNYKPSRGRNKLAQTDEMQEVHLRATGEKIPDRVLSGKLLSPDGEVSALGQELIRYFCRRAQQVSSLLDDLREEEEGLEEMESLGLIAKKHKPQSPGQSESPRIVQQTIEAISQRVAAESGMEVNTDPGGRCVMFVNDHLLVTPRRMDGALPGLFNPVALWEIKEYWGRAGGSKMSDVVYESELVGWALYRFNKALPSAAQVHHYVIIDGKGRWKGDSRGGRQSDLGRLVDLLNQGLISELLYGKNILPEWTRILHEEAERYQAREAKNSG